MNGQVKSVYDDNLKICVFSGSKIAVYVKNNRFLDKKLVINGKNVSTGKVIWNNLWLLFSDLGWYGNEKFVWKECN